MADESDHPPRPPLSTMLFTEFVEIARIISFIVLNMYLIITAIFWFMKKKKTKEPGYAMLLFPLYFNETKPSVAEERAAKLLWDHLTPEQREEVLEKTTITIHSGGANLKLDTTQPYATVLKRKHSTYYRSVCINIVGGHLPMGDVLLAKKLAFECDPKVFCDEARG